MKKLDTYLLFLFAMIFYSCSKDVVIDKQSKMSAKINNTYLSANEATAMLEKSSFFSGKGQLTLTGEDDKNKIVIIMKDYDSQQKIYTLPNPLFIVTVTSKTSGISDTASNGQLEIKQVTNNFYAIPELKPSQYATGQLYKSEIIIGGFEFTTGNNTVVTNGIFGISFNK